MNKKVYIIALIAISLLFGGCGSSDSENKHSAYSVEKEESSFGIWITGISAKFGHNPDKLARVTRYYLAKGDLNEALEYAEIDFTENGNQETTLMVIDYCIKNKKYDRAGDLALTINNENYIEKIAKLYIDNEEYDKAFLMAENVFGLKDKLVQYRWKMWEQKQQYDLMLAQLKEDLSEDCRYPFTSISDEEDCNDIYNNDNAKYNQKLDNFVYYALSNNQIQYATKCLSLYQPYSYLVGRTLIKKRTILSDVYRYRFETRNPDRAKAEQKIKSASEGKL